MNENIVLKYNQLPKEVVRTIALIIAAGASSRLGQPKSLVEIRGQSVYKLTVEKLRKAGIKKIYCVTRQELSVDLMLESESVNVVVNPKPEMGRTGSIQEGLLSIMKSEKKRPKTVLLVPIDRPSWSLKTIEDLLSQELASAPIHGGHPMIIHSDDMDEILSSQRDTPLRDIIKFERIFTDELEQINLDYPEDIEKLIANSDDIFPE